MTDLVVHDAVVVTVDERNRLYERGTVAVDDGRISQVRKTEDGDAALDADRVIDGDGKLVMPGLVNAHSHLELSALIGAFSEMEPWNLFSASMPLFQGFVEGEYEYLLEASVDLAALAFANAGITTVNSMDVSPAAGAEAFGEAGLRGTFGAPLSDMFLDDPVDEQFRRAREFVEEYHGAYGGRVRAALAPHDDWSCSRSLWERVADLHEEYPDLQVHTHLLELDESNEMARSNGARDSLALLDDVGLLDDDLLAAHFRVADDRDVERMAAADASVAHCASVFSYFNPDPDAPWTPVQDLRAADVSVGLGLDDHYWHDSYDLFGEARQARLSANLADGANQYTSMELVRMLTVEGAEAMGMGDELGSLEPGKRADFLILDVDQPKFTPLTNVPAQVVNNAAAGDVETVVVDGDVVVEDRTVLTMDADAVREKVEAAVDRFEDETGWDLGAGGGDPPGALELARDAPKRGPARLLGRLGVQKAKDSLEI